MKTYKGTREAFAAAFMELAAEREDIMLVSPDALKAMRAVPFAEKYPERYVEVGIAEQGAVDVAAGIAASSLTPFVVTYAGFLTMRACEQMRTFVAYPNLNVKFVGLNGGIVGGEREGATHQFYEDISILSAIPNIKIFTPADPQQTYEAIKEAYNTPGPVYVRIGSGREIDVYPEGEKFSKDGVRVLKDYGNDATVFANGFIMDRVLDAAEILKEEGIGIKVADVNIIDNSKPNEKIIDIIKDSEHIFTVEDHNINGGLGSYISCLACENSPVWVKRIGLTTFGESGPAKELADQYGFSPEAISETIRKSI